MVLCGELPSKIFPGLKGNTRLGRFDSLPNDVLLLMTWYLNASSLCKLGGTCSFFKDITNYEALWMCLCEREFKFTTFASYAEVSWKVRYIKEYCLRNGILTVLPNVRQIPTPKPQPGVVTMVTSGFTSLWHMVFPKQQLRLLMVGLDAGGKTTILYRLKLGVVVTTIPTIGFNVETVEHKEIDIICWDVGGPDKIRPLWRHYYQNTQVLIFVVDSNDRERIDEAALELNHFLREDELRDAVLLVFANKQDLPTAMSVSEVTDRLGLNAIRRRPWYIQACCATTGEGLPEGLDWLASQKLAK